MMNHTFTLTETGVPTSDSVFLYALTALTTVSLTTLMIYRQRENNKKKPCQTVPGWLPLVGHMHHIKSIPYLMHTLEPWADKYGSKDGCYEMYMGMDRYIVICRADLALQVFSQRPKLVTRSLPMTSSANSIGANGVFAAEGEQWRHEHRVVAPTLNLANVQDYSNVFRIMVDRLLQKWENVHANEGQVTIDQDLASMSADAIAKVSLDRDYDFINHPTGQTALDVQTSMTALVQRAVSPMFYWNIPFIGQYLDGCGTSIFRLTKLINSVVSEYESGKDRSKGTFLEKLYNVMQSEKSPLSRDRVVGNVMTLFLAGTDTTSRTLTMCLYLLAQDEKLQQELYEEAKDFDINDIHVKDMYQQLPRLKAFLHEVHRCYAVPFMPLRTVAEIPYAGGTLPKNTDIIVLTRYINMLPSDDVPDSPMGKKAGEFCPYRWIVTGEDGKVASLSPKYKSTSFLGFGHGVRACPGRAYSEVLSYMTLVALFQKYNISLTPNHPRPPIILDTTMVPDCKVQLVLQNRN